MDIQEKRKAVAFLAANTEEQPENVTEMFVVLKGHEQDVVTIQSEIKRAQDAIENLARQLERKIGAIEATADAIGTLIPEDSIEEWAEKYENPEE